jgi:hypothetical protein
MSLMMNYAAIWLSDNPEKERAWQKDLLIIRERRLRREQHWQHKLDELNIDHDPYYREEPRVAPPPIVWTEQELAWRKQCLEMDEYQKSYDACATY